ncbi:MAG: hypothetical protein OSA24_05160 [Longimicrobiales bacterium]|jgi:hypothetical protein|nr:hypothetical protein [Longimicrobiales bacterium]
MLGFSKKNIIFAVVGITVIAGGHWLLGQGSITAAPVLLVLGYLVLVPLSIIS